MQNIKNSTKFLKRFFEPAFKNKKATVKMLFEGSITTFWFDVLPLFSIPFLVKLIDKQNVSQIFVFSISISLLYIILWIIGYKTRHWDFEAKSVIEQEMEKLYRLKFLYKDSLKVENIGTGQLQAIIQKGIIRWADGLWQMIYQIPRIILGISSGLYLTASFGFQYVLLFSIFVILSVASYYFFRKKELAFQEKLNEIENLMTAHSVRMIMSRSEILLAGTGEMETQKLVDILEEQKKLQKVGQKYDFMADWSISSTIIILPLAGVFLSIWNKDIYHLSAVLIIPFIYFASRFSFLMWQFVWSLRQFLDVYPQVKKLWDFIDNTPAIKNYEEGKEFIHGTGEIEMQNINFSYNDKEKNNEKVLKDFSLKIKGKTRVALVGKSGSGKTTIAKLISGYLKIETNDSNSGKVFIDGQDITELSLKSYYKYVGYLTQEPMVFDGSIRENLLYAVSKIEKQAIISNLKDLPHPLNKGEFPISEISEEKIKEVLIKAKCDFVFKFEKGLDTQIGEKGIRLSGGERQRLAIAKLFLKNPEIIILDEPTSALDSFSEEVISKSLDELFKDRTVIIIAHRLQTVKKADIIIVLEDGEILETGKHDELIAKNGAYAKMLELQSGF